MRTGVWMKYSIVNLLLVFAFYCYNVFVWFTFPFWTRKWHYCIATGYKLQTRVGGDLSSVVLCPDAGERSYSCLQTRRWSTSTGQPHARSCRFNQIQVDPGRTNPFLHHYAWLTSGSVTGDVSKWVQFRVLAPRIELKSQDSCCYYLYFMYMTEIQDKMKPLSFQ